MNVLLVYPKFPDSFWSFEKALALVGKKAMLPPLGLVTVAALLPQEWEFNLVDRNIREISEAEWDEAELVMLSAMIVQKADCLNIIKEANQRGKPVAVGGPYPTALPREVDHAGADYLVLDEGEITLHLFLEALEAGTTKGIFHANGEKPDVTKTPIPRFDLLDFEAYSEMAVQFSRGCPFNCEFCDIIILYGNKPRTKTPDQMIAEFQHLYELGWRRSIFVVDDNFIGNKKKVKEFLRVLRPWMEAHDYPFTFDAEASLDLAKDQELMDLMTACNFGAVFLGIETPDTESLTRTQKHQNLRDPLKASVEKIINSGLRVMAGFIIGFDGESKGAGDRIVRFVEETTIPTAFLNMLQVLPNTALWKRLKQERRLLNESGTINQTTLINFIPTRPLEEVAQEYIKGFWDLYDPLHFLGRTYRHYRLLGEAAVHKKPKKKISGDKKNIDGVMIRALLTICWRQGIMRRTRSRFWSYLFKIYRHNRGGVVSYLSVCAQIEHFLPYREIVKKQIQSQVAEIYSANPSIPALKLGKNDHLKDLHCPLM